MTRIVGFVFLLVCCAKPCPDPKPVYLIAGEGYVQILEASPSTLMKFGQWKCVPDGNVAPQYEKPIVEFVRQNLMGEDRRSPRVVVGRYDENDTNDTSPLRLAGRTISGHAWIGVDARSRRGVVIVNASWGTDFYCVDRLPGGHLVLDMFMSLRS